MTLKEKWAKIFNTTETDWEYWRKEHGCSEKLIIAGPSRIIGLINLSKFNKNIEWKMYGKCSEPTKKMKGNFVFDGGMYGITWLRDIYPELPESLEVARYNGGILFKINEDIAVGIGDKITGDEFYYNDEGVMFIELKFEETKEEWRTTTTAKEFIKWDNNMAKRKHGGSKLHEWFEDVYRFEYFFEEEEEMGDFMLI